MRQSVWEFRFLVADDLVRDKKLPVTNVILAEPVNEKTEVHIQDKSFKLRIEKLSIKR